MNTTHISSSPRWTQHFSFDYSPDKGYIFRPQLICFVVLSMNGIINDLLKNDTWSDSKEGAYECMRQKVEDAQRTLDLKIDGLTLNLYDIGTKLAVLMKHPEVSRPGSGEYNIRYCLWQNLKATQSFKNNLEKLLRVLPVFLDSLQEAATYLQIETTSNQNE